MPQLQLDHRLANQGGCLLNATSQLDLGLATGLFLLCVVVGCWLLLSLLLFVIFVCSQLLSL